MANCFAEKWILYQWHIFSPGNCQAKAYSWNDGKDYSKFRGSVQITVTSTCYPTKLLSPEQKNN